MRLHSDPLAPRERRLPPDVMSGAPGRGRIGLQTDPSLLAVLQSRAEEDEARGGFVFLGYGANDVPTESRMGFKALGQRARAVAAALQVQCGKGDRALILCPPGLDYIAAFYGCVMAGVVAVPAYPPRNARHMGRLATILADSEAAAILTVSDLSDRLTGWAGAEVVLPWRLAVDVIDPAASEHWRDPGVGPDDLVFLQYTSGTTGTPKGVMVSHAQLLANVERIAGATGLDRSSVGTLWLPPYHDMGLVAGLVATVHVGFLNVLMAPTSFLQRPARWLEAMSTYRASHTVAPNFGYRLCVEQISEAERPRFDLSSLLVAMNGAEVVRGSTLREFAAAFAPAGFRKESFFPCYGLAETVVMAACVAAFSGWVESRAGLDAPASLVDSARDLVARASGAMPETLRPNIVSSGRVIAGHELRIVDPETRRERAAGEVGEIWLAGPSVAAGYWRKPDATAEVFGACLDGSADRRAYLRTGDLGAVWDGELYVLGRIKEMVIIRGRNHYATDLETTASSSHPTLGADRMVGFADDSAGEERLVLVHELSRAAMRDLDAPVLFRAIRAAVLAEHEVDPAVIVLVRPATLPRTSSGKLRRGETRVQFGAGTLETVATWSAGSSAEATAAPVPRSGVKTELTGRADLLLPWLQTQVQAILHLDQQPAAELSIDALGIDSLMTVELLNRITAEVGPQPPLDLEALAESASLAALADELARRSAGDPAAPGVPDPEPVPTVSATMAPVPGRDLNLNEFFWVLESMSLSDTTAICMVTLLEGELSEDALRAACDAVHARHPILRARIVRVGRRARFEHFDAPVWLNWHEASSTDVMDEAVARGGRVDFGSGPALLRWTVVSDPVRRRHALLLLCHHALLDGISAALLINQVLLALDGSRSFAPISCDSPVDATGLQLKRFSPIPLLRLAALWLPHGVTVIPHEATTAPDDRSMGCVGAVLERDATRGLLAAAGGSRGMDAHISAAQALAIHDYRRRQSQRDAGVTRIKMFTPRNLRQDLPPPLNTSTQTLMMAITGRFHIAPIRDGASFAAVRARVAATLEPFLRAPPARILTRWYPAGLIERLFGGDEAAQGFDEAKVTFIGFVPGHPPSANRRVVARLGHAVNCKGRLICGTTGTIANGRMVLTMSYCAPLLSAESARQIMRDMLRHAGAPGDTPVVDGYDAVARLIDPAGPVSALGQGEVRVTA